MRLEDFCEMKLTYRAVALYEGINTKVRPYGTDEAAIYGEGDILFMVTPFKLKAVGPTTRAGEAMA